MPKFGIHYVVLDELRSRLRDSADPDEAEIGRILTAHRLAASTGCIGPDLLFWAPDYGVVEGLRDLVEAYDAVIEKWRRVEDVAEVVGTTIERGVDAVLDGLEEIPVVGDAIGVARDLDAVAEAFDVLVEAFDTEWRQALLLRVTGLDGGPGSDGNTLARSLFHGLFQSTQQAGREEMDWYWFEMLHYRRTGDMAKALVRRAETSGEDQLRAYAYGYLTHYAADLVGHPFVNTVSGSPYRMNVQRHVVIENFMDQWVWGRRFGGRNIRNDLFGRMGFTEDDELPPAVAELIADTLREVYADVAHPLRYVRDTAEAAEATGVRPDRDGFLTARDVRTAFTFQKLMLHHLGGQDVPVRPAEPYPGADADLADLIAAGDGPAPPPPPDALPTDPQSLMEAVDAWLAAAAAAVEELLDAVGRAFDAVLDDLERLLADPAAEVTRRIQLMAYAVQMGMYQVYREIHQVIALSGLAYPEPDDAALTSPVAESLVTTRHVAYKSFPVLRTPGQPHLDTRSYRSVMEHRDDRFAEAENPETIASHYRDEDGGDTPDGFIDGVPLDEALLREYAEAETPAVTRQLQTTHRRSFGNAVDLSRMILRHRVDGDDLEHVAFCNWNLDGDRGYGYKCWDGVPFTVWRGEMDGAIDQHEPLDEVLQQNRSVWTSATVVADGPDVVSRYTAETYVERKRPGSALLAPLDISTYYIPAMFTRPALMPGVDAALWSTLLPRRFRRPDALTGTVVFCNGATTSPSSGIRCTLALQKTLDGALAAAGAPPVRVAHLHNHSSPDWGDLSLLGDLLEAVLGDYLGAIENAAAVRGGGPARDVTNPTQVAALALLHHAMEGDVPLVLAGHSQGTMITANAVLVFATLGDRHRTYLRERVRVLHLAPELLEGVRDALRPLVRDYLVYIMNDSDPEGTDLLTELTSGVAPGVPGQAGLLTSGSATTAVRRLLADPDPLDPQLYARLQAVVAGADTDVTTLVRLYAAAVNSPAHFMPVQLAIIIDDIVGNRFRTDPATLANPTVTLSTPAPLNPTSVPVRQFFVAG